MIRTGCVPYLNAKPLIDWFHSPDCDPPAEIVYAAPSELACLLREGAVDVALVSSYELFRNPRLTLLPGLPFVYAAWLARPECDLQSIESALLRAKEWGTARLEELATIWAAKMNLPIERVREYFLEIMQYDLTAKHMAGFEEFHNRCRQHNLIAEPLT